MGIPIGWEIIRGYITNVTDFAARNLTKTMLSAYEAMPMKATSKNSNDRIHLS